MFNQELQFRCFRVAFDRRFSYEMFLGLAYYQMDKIYNQDPSMQRNPLPAFRHYGPEKNETRPCCYVYDGDLNNVNDHGWLSKKSMMLMLLPMKNNDSIPFMYTRDVKELDLKNDPYAASFLLDFIKKSGYSLQYGSMPDIDFKYLIDDKEDIVADYVKHITDEIENINVEFLIKNQDDAALKIHRYIGAVNLLQEAGKFKSPDSFKEMIKDGKELSEDKVLTAASNIAQNSIIEFEYHKKLSDLRKTYLDRFSQLLQVSGKSIYDIKKDTDHYINLFNNEIQKIQKDLKAHFDVSSTVRDLRKKYEDIIEGDKGIYGKYKKNIPVKLTEKEIAQQLRIIDFVEKCGFKSTLTKHFADPIGALKPFVRSYAVNGGNKMTRGALTTNSIGPQHYESLMIYREELKREILLQKLGPLKKQHGQVSLEESNKAKKEIAKLQSELKKLKDLLVANPLLEKYVRSNIIELEDQIKNYGSNVKDSPSAAARAQITALEMQIKEYDDKIKKMISIFPRYKAFYNSKGEIECKDTRPGVSDYASSDITNFPILDDNTTVVLHEYGHDDKPYDKNEIY